MTMTVEDAVEQEAGKSLPGSYRALAADLSAGVATAFLCWGGGTADYAQGSQFYADWLAQKLAKHFEIVVRYNIGAIDEAIRFADPSMRKQFEILAGLRDERAPSKPAANDPFGAMRQATGQLGGGGGGKPYPTSALEIVRMLLKVLRSAEKLSAAVIIERMDLLVPPSDKGVLPEGQRSLLGMLHAAGTDTVIETKGNPLVMLAPTLESVHADLRGASSGIRSLEVPLPRTEDRLEFIGFLKTYYETEAKSSGRKPVKLDIPVDEMAALTAGLYRRHIQDVWLRGEAQGMIGKQLVISRKNEIMLSEYAEVLETMQPRFNFASIGGNPLLKAWLMKHIVQRMRDGDVRRFPKGIVFTGPAGTGKSLFAEALGFELGINVVLLRPEKIKGGIYGESEQKLARAFAGIAANTPCVVFIDEIDQRFRRGGGAGGAADAAEDNIFGRTLEFVGDPSTRGQIIWVAATNRPDVCDAALFRPGRFDEKLPILPATDEERPDVYKTLVRRHAEDSDVADLERTFKAVDWNKIVRLSDGWTGAEIEQAVISAYDLWELDDVPLSQAIEQATEQLLPSTRDIERHTALAIAACNRRELIPPKYRAIAADENAQERAVAEIQKGDRMRSRRDLIED